MELVDLSRSSETRDSHRVLESGNILFFPTEASGLSPEDKEFLRSVHLSGGKLHKNVAYKPAQDRVSGFESSSPELVARLRSVMRKYSTWAVEFTGRVLPRYKSSWSI